MKNNEYTVGGWLEEVFEVTVLAKNADEAETKAYEILAQENPGKQVSVEYVEEAD